MPGCPGSSFARAGLLGHRLLEELGNSLFDPIYHVPGLDKLIMAVPPGGHQDYATGGRLELVNSDLFGHWRAGLRHHRRLADGLLAHGSW